MISTTDEVEKTRLDDIVPRLDVLRFDNVYSLGYFISDFSNDSI